MSEIGIPCFPPKRAEVDRKYWFGRPFFREFPCVGHTATADARERDLSFVGQKSASEFRSCHEVMRYRSALQRLMTSRSVDPLGNHGKKTIAGLVILH